MGLIVSHLPFGPTAYFTLCNVVMRHDIPDLGTMSEAKPHLIMHGLSSRLGKRVSLGTRDLGWGQGCQAGHSLFSFALHQVSDILRYLFPVPKEDSHRVITFANQDDYISFRCVWGLALGLYPGLRVSGLSVVDLQLPPPVLAPGTTCTGRSATETWS